MLRSEMTDEYLCQLLDTDLRIAERMINVSAVVVEYFLKKYSEERSKMLTKKFINILDQWSRTGKDCAKVYIAIQFPGRFR